MSILGHLEPTNVFRFFEEICNIPHGSGNIDKISDYLVDFAKERNLEYYQDAIKNVIIINILLPEIKCPYKNIGNTYCTRRSVAHETNKLNYIVNKRREMLRWL